MVQTQEFIPILKLRKIGSLLCPRTAKYRQLCWHENRFLYNASLFRKYSWENVVINLFGVDNNILFCPIGLYFNWKLIAMATALFDAIPDAVSGSIEKAEEAIRKLISLDLNDPKNLFALQKATQQFSVMLNTVSQELNALYGIAKGIIHNIT